MQISDDRDCKKRSAGFFNNYNQQGWLNRHMKHSTEVILKLFAWAVSLTLLFAQSSFAQNLIQDGGFDGAPQSGFGDRGSEVLQPWYFATVTPYIVVLNNHNLVSVDGPGGYDYSNLGPESDASGVGAGVAQYYLDSGNSGQLAWQYFTPTCSGQALATAMFTNREDHGRAEGTIVGPQAPSTNNPGQFFSTEGGLSVFLVSSPIPEFAPGYHVAQPATAQLVEDLYTRHQDEELRFVLGATPTQTSPWQLVGIENTVQAGQLYVLVAELGQSVNMDDVSVELDCANAGGTPNEPGNGPSGMEAVDTTKSCDPLVDMGAGNFELTCELTVVASGLDPNEYIVLADLFAGQNTNSTPPLGALPFQTNFSYSDPWNCGAPPNAPYEWCEISVADLNAAGGSSTITSTTTFQNPEDFDQAFNCLIGDSGEAQSPYNKNQSNQFDSLKMAARSATRNPSSQFGDDCVVLDLPDPGGSTNPVKLESVRLRKMCDDPVQGTHNGAQGYFWNCDIDIMVQPAPFNGTFTLTEDASNISSGQAEFVSATIPCSGIATDTLTCEIDGNTMSQPHPVSVQLFTEIVSGEEPVEWQNCASGRAETSAAAMSSGKTCFQTLIKPIVVTDPPKELAVKKSCDADPVLTTLNGVEGISWTCEITAVANPAPFSGIFAIHEDATSITGTSTGEIVAMTPQNNAWACAANLPSSQTSCQISGAAFDPSGEETIRVDLFAPVGKEPITWENCVGGIYTQSRTQEEEIGGNCQTMTWNPEPQEPPKLSLKKSCEGPTEFGDAQRYICTIAVSNAGGAVTTPLTLEELFANTVGASATDYLLQLLGSPGWACASAPFTNGASCDITATDFNANNGHQISGIFLIPDAVLAEQDFENCAALKVGDKPVAEAQCIPIKEPIGEPTFDIEKVCEAAGDRQEISKGNWIQPYACTLTVTTNGMPFSHPLLVADAMSYGTFSGNSLVGQLTSSDPWQCVQPPYAAPGQGNQPACIIQGYDFPHANGSSSINFVMTIQGNVADQYGAQNCGKLYTTIPTDSTEPPIVAQSCVTIVDPPVVQEPTLSVFKTCSPAVRTGGNGPWTVSCNVTVNGANLPSGHQIRITDELTGAGLNAPTGGGFNQGLFTQNCGNAAVSNGIGEACDITTDDITNAGGSLTFPYSGSLNGPGGRSLPGFKYPQNCTYATLPSIGLNAPDTGKVCVEIPLELSAIGGGIPDLGTGAPAVLDEGMAVLDPNINPIPFKPSLSVAKFQTEACVANRNTQRYTCGFRLGVTNSGPGAFSGPMVLTDTFTSPGGQAVTVLSGGGWSCANPVNGAISCENASLTLAPGATSNIDLSMQVQGLVRGGSFQNCAALGIPDDRRQRVAAIQQVMNARGLNAGPVDGQPGRRTYAALAELQRSLGLPVSQSFDDGLFRALGLVLQEPGKQSCITVDLPRMPPAPLQCDAATTVPRGESCACRYDNMIQRNTASCQCRAGYVFTADRGCTPAPKPDPTPTPRPTPDTPRPAPDTPSQPRCENGLPRVNGKCLSIQIMPGGGGDGPAGADGCRIMVGGVCIK